MTSGMKFLVVGGIAGASPAWVVRVDAHLFEKGYRLSGGERRIIVPL